MLNLLNAYRDEAGEVFLTIEKHIDFGVAINICEQLLATPNTRSLRVQMIRVLLTRMPIDELQEAVQGLPR